MLDSIVLEAIFARMLARYGSSWRAKWQGVAPEAIAADWQRVLGSMPRYAILYGLEHMPADFPPTAPQFREVCLRAPEPKRAPELDAPRPDLLRRKAELERLRAKLSKRGPRQGIDDLLQRQRGGERLSMFQKQCLANAIGAPAVGEEIDDRERTAELKRKTQRMVDEYVPLL